MSNFFLPSWQRWSLEGGCTQDWHLGTNERVLKCNSCNRTWKVGAGVAEFFEKKLNGWRLNCFLQRTWGIFNDLEVPQWVSIAQGKWLRLFTQQSWVRFSAHLKFSDNGNFVRSNSGRQRNSKMVPNKSVYSNVLVSDCAPYQATANRKFNPVHCLSIETRYEPTLAANRVPNQSCVKDESKPDAAWLQKLQGQKFPCRSAM